MDSSPTSGPNARELDLLRRMARIANIGGWEYDPSARQLYWTEQVFRIVELDPYSVAPTLESAIGFYAPEARATMARAVQGALDGGEAWDLELPLVTARGRRIWVRVIGEPEMVDGRCVRLAGTVEDVTAARRARQALKARSAENRRLALVAENTSNLVLITGPDHRIEWTNASFTRATGYAAAEAIGRTPCELLCRGEPGADPQLAAAREWMQRGDAVRGLQVELTRKDGSRYWAEVEVRVVLDERGAPSNYIHIHNDITERKAAEQRMAAAAQQLTDALARLELATGGSEIGIFERPLDKSPGYWSAQMFRLYGEAPQPVAPTWEWLLERIEPEDHALFESQWERIKRSSAYVGTQFRIRRPDGSRAWLLTRARLEPADAVRPARVVGIGIDITQRKEAEDRASQYADWLRLTARTIGIGLWQRELDGGPPVWDGQTKRLFGLTEDAPTPTPAEYLEFVLPEDRARVAEASSSVPPTGEPLEIEYRIRRADGAVRTILSRRAVHCGPDGRPLRVLGAAIDVTESRAALARAAEAAQMLQLATKAVGMGFSFRDLATGACHWDAQARAIFGFPLEGPAPSIDEFLSRVDEHDRAQVASAYTNPPAAGTHDEIEYGVCLPDGRVRRVLSRYGAQYDERGGACRLYAAVIDVTASREAEVRLRDALERLRLAAEAGGIASWEHDLETGEARWDEVMFDLYGLPRGPVAPALDVVLSLVHPDDRAILADAYKRMAHSTGAVEWECRILRRDGGIVHLLSRGRADRGDDGRVRRIVGATIDVTEIRRVQRERDELSNRLRLATASVGMGVWVWDLATRTSVWDEAMYALFGVTREQFADRIWLDAVHPEDRAHAARAVQDALDGTAPLDTVFRVIWPDGTVHHVASRGSVERDARGAAVRMVGVNWDVTERRTAEAALLAKEAAERASRAKTEFLSRMSHELRTPLNAIIGFTQVLELDRTHPLAPVQRDRIDKIQQAGWHLLNLINEILDLARIEAGALQLSMATVALAEVVDECVALINADAQRRALSIGQAQTARAPAHVWADRTRLKQVLLNLLSNAVKYNREGGRIDVEVDADAEGRALVTVRDTGPGLAPDQIERLFRPFERLGMETTAIEGTGIGLTIARRLIEQMGGELSVTSEPGAGSAFHIALQAASSARDEAADVLQSIAPVSVEPRDDVRGTVLYVEDNPSNVEVVEQLLALRPNVKLFTAGDGASGRVMAAVCQPDLILLDMRLPDTDGLSLFAELAERPETRSIPCIGLSANALPADIARARAAGFADYWTKPIEAGPFLRGIDAALGRPR